MCPQKTLALFIILNDKFGDCLLHLNSGTRLNSRIHTHKQMPCSTEASGSRTVRGAQERSGQALPGQGGQRGCPRRGDFWSECLQLELRTRSVLCKSLRQGEALVDLNLRHCSPLSPVYQSQYSSVSSNFLFFTSIHGEKYILHCNISASV